MLNIQEIKEIIKLVDASGIDEFSYEANGSKVKLKKTNVIKQDTQRVNEVKQITEEVSLPQQSEASIITEPVPQKQEEASSQTTVDFDYEIKSPMVGTFYRASSPENDPYVEVGSTVNASSVVCIVEAMKLFNEIEAEVTGEIVEILVEDSELVEYGQPLFRVKKK